VILRLRMSEFTGNGKGKVHPTTGHEGPDGEYRLLLAIQVQTLKGLMEINSLSVSYLNSQHSRKCEGRNGAEKLEPGQNIYYMHCW
jgi:hypothetical protein